MRTKYLVNNLSGQTINGQAIDPKYKVYTALLTQSGGDNVQVINSGDLTIGVTYKINVVDTDGDFTNVGAPNNDAETYFVATGATPNSWGTNGELKYNNGAPVVTVLENTIGNIWFSYRNQGEYFVNSIDLFTTDKTAISIDTYGQNGVFISTISYGQLTISEFIIFTYKDGPTDGILYKNTLEIRVYN